MKTTLEILREARELISAPERWATGTLARDLTGYSVSPFSKLAASWCMIGAIRRCSADYDLEVPARNFLREFTQHQVLNTFNDAHTHAEVLAAFDKAIEAEEQKNEHA